MGDWKIRLLSINALILAGICFVSCGSQKNTESQTVTEDPTPIQVSNERYREVREGVQHFIGDLNTVISRKNFNAWKAVLSTGYINEVSSPRNLDRLSESNAMKSQKIVLKTLEDYFTYVVVPSRAAVDIDKIDIEFVGQNRVKAFTVTTNNKSGEEQRLRLYDLEQSGNSWKIIN